MKKNSSAITKELLETILKEGKITILSDELKIRISEYSDRILNINLKNIYNNSPSFFQELKTNDILSKYYKKFIILCCLLDYSDVDSSEEFFINWRKLHQDDNIKAFLQGPLVNSKMKFDYIKYYNSIINPSIESIEGYHQISLLQNHSKILEKINSDIKSLECSLERFPKNANGYQIFIDTSKINRKSVINDNFIIDLSNIDFGIPSIEHFQSSIKKIEYLFNNFTRLKTKLRVYKNLYKQSLDTFKHCFIIFDGINVFDRTIYTLESDYLRVGGRFVLKNDWFEFIPDFKRVIFRNSNQKEFKMNDVNRFRIYIISDDSKLSLKSNRTIKINKIYNEKSLTQINNGFINISNRFVYCTYTNTLQEINEKRINKKDNDDIYYWKEFSDVFNRDSNRESLGYSNDDRNQSSNVRFNKAFNVNDMNQFSNVKFNKALNNESIEFYNRESLNAFDREYKTFPLKFSKRFDINKINEDFIKDNIKNCRIIINEFSEEPSYSFEENHLIIEDEEYSLPCFYKGFLFYLENNQLKINHPNEYEENNIKYRIIRFSNNPYLELPSLENTNKTDLELSITNPFKNPSSYNDYIDGFRDGKLYVELEDEDSVIFSNNSILMRTDIKNLYTVYGNRNIQKEMIKEGKEIELMLNFS